jgi:hypothetical protein
MAFTIDIEDNESNTDQVVITEQGQLDGVNSARLQYNLDNEETEDFEPLTTNAGYIAFVLRRAFQSYDNQYLRQAAPEGKAKK